MIPSELERLIVERKAKGHIPFFVNATAGTTVLGAFDPIEPIADICQKYKLWLHVDVSIQLLDTVLNSILLQHTAAHR
jgi:glutamate decarboxylase